MSRTTASLIYDEAFLDYDRIYAPGDTFVLDFQFFAADDEGRTEEPTETKKRKAREEGKVPKSQDLSAAFVLLFSFWGISLFGHLILEAVRDTFTFFFSGINGIDVSLGNVNALIIKCVVLFFRMVWPIFLISVLVAVFSNLVQVGFLFTWKPLKPELKKISFTPKKLFEKIFFSKQSMMNLLKSLVKIGGVGLIAYLIIQSDLIRMLNLINVGVIQGLNEITSTIFKLVNAACVTLIILAVPDYVFQYRQHKESLKMATHEIKEEHKEQEGDPLIKQKIMEKSRELIQRNLPENVRKADVVITNPTHIAIALQFDMMQHDAPVVTAKGADHMAFQIRQLATDAGVSLVENKPLAWALYETVEIGDPISAELYEAVVMIYQKLDRFRQAAAV